MEFLLVSQRQDRKRSFSGVITTWIEGEDAHGSHMHLFPLHPIFFIFCFQNEPCMFEIQKCVCVSEVYQSSVFSS